MLSFINSVKIALIFQGNMLNFPWDYLYHKNLVALRIYILSKWNFQIPILECQKLFIFIHKYFNPEIELELRKFHCLIWYLIFGPWIALDRICELAASIAV